MDLVEHLGMTSNACERPDGDDGDGRSNICVYSCCKKIKINIYIYIFIYLYICTNMLLVGGLDLFWFFPIYLEQSSPVTNIFETV